jgi:nitrogen fixation protein FixH
MKINWGTGVVIAFALFMAFILYFVFLVQSDTKYDNELVVEDYYIQEGKAQENIEKETNVLNLTGKVKISKENNILKIQFPAEFINDSVQGTVKLYRPSDKKFDFTLPIKLTNNEMIVPQDKLLPGNWEVILDWKHQGKDYLINQSVYF